MATKWPDGWVKVPCSNGHEIQSYEQVHHSDTYGDVSGICDVCGVPYMFRFPHSEFKGFTPYSMPPTPIPIPTDTADYNDLPPFLPTPPGDDWERD